jgi:anhydro-N-acetylmuramic acid kinase
MPAASELYVGLMSGTSLDAVDAVLVSFGDDLDRTVATLATLEHAFPEALRSDLLALIETGTTTSLDDLGRIDRQLGMLYAEAVMALLNKAGREPREITAIGLHGQTIRHRTDVSPAFTMQIGDAATVANLTGITTVADFRSADIALGGQGAPLAPLFHAWAFSAANEPSVVVNLGGIANITILTPDEPVIGYDTGPSNTLLDNWYSRHHKDSRFDAAGTWAASGNTIDALLQGMLDDPYFKLPAPKSTGREYFNGPWVDAAISGIGKASNPADIQATLAELTAATVAAAAVTHLESGSIRLCGGGVQNTNLTERLAQRLPDFTVTSTAELGVEPGWVEATAFAWLARARLQHKAAGEPSVTGAKAAAILGAIHLPPEA